MPQILSPHSRALAATIETHAPRARVPQQEKPLQWEVCALQQGSSPSSLQLEKAHSQQWRPREPEDEFKKKTPATTGRISRATLTSDQLTIKSRLPTTLAVQSQSCPTLCNPMDSSMPGFPVYYRLPELAQTHVHWIGDAIQPPHPLSPSSPALNLSQHHSLFKWVGSSHSGDRSIGASALASVLPKTIQGWFPLGFPSCPRDSQESFSTP